MRARIGAVLDNEYYAHLTQPTLDTPAKAELNKYNIDLVKETGLAIVQPDGALSESDFDSIASVIDPYLQEHGELRGLIYIPRIFQVGILLVPC